MDEQKLRNILSNFDAPEPEKTAQKQTVDAALLAFDKKIQENTQGKTATGRLTGINPFKRAGRPTMEQQNKKSSKNLKQGIALLTSGIALLSLPFMTNVMQGSIGQGMSPDPALVHNKIQSFDDGYSLDSKQFAANITSNDKSISDRYRMAEQEAAPALSRAVEEQATIGSAAPGKKMAGDMLKERKDTSPAKTAPQPYVAGGARQEVDAVAKRMPATSPVPVMQGLVAQEMIAPGVMPPDAQPDVYRDEGRDKFEEVEQSPIKQVSSEPVSTFSIDVDTSSYSFMRRMINRGQLPAPGSVRPEELINYFPYSYPTADSREAPFQPTVAVTPSPWRAGAKLVHIGIKGYDIAHDTKPRANLVFLLDVSGSMNSPDKLPLVKNSLKMMLDTMNPEDTISIVTYAGHAGTALEPTPASEKHRIIAALDSLGAAGSTAGAQGIEQAYNLAKQSFVEGGVNRVILATDGDFNVGINNPDQLKEFIEDKRDSGIFLSVLGFGQGNYNDHLMQSLAQNGNGVAAYIDTLSEARKVLVEESTSTLFTIAKDVKIQVEFNPKLVQEYRLIGYETRHLNREDFNNDKVDAGDVGAGHAVTAIYEITPVGATPVVDALRYGETAEKAEEIKEGGAEYAFLKMRYKLPNESVSKLITRPITHADDVELAKAPEDTRFATAVAGFAELLKRSKYSGTLTYDDVIAQAEGARGRDEFGYRTEFVNLVRLAKSIDGQR